MEILLARLRKLAGEGRVGAAELLDTHAPEAFRMTKFAPEAAAPFAAHSPSPSQNIPRPISPRTRLRCACCGRRAPSASNCARASRWRCATTASEALVEAGSGPWRSDGAWWTEQAWCREEWEVAVGAAKHAPHESGGLAHAPPRCLRLAHDPASGGWYVIGMYD